MSERPSARERLAQLQGAGPTSDELVSMVRDGEAVIGESDIGGGSRLDLEASNLRRERTGIHAKVVLSLDGAILAYDTFNIERGEERRKLAVAAATTLGDAKAKSQVLRMRVDQFCARAWECWIGSVTPEVRRGSDVPASQMLLHPYLTDSRTILFAPGGSAKSWLALIWALSLNYGLEFPWRAERPVKTLWVDFEDTPQAFDFRLRRAARLLDCPEELPAYHFDGRFVDVWDPMRRYLDSNDVGLIVVDSISRLALGNLNDNEPANKAIDMLNRLGVPWLALAHTRKDAGEHVFGSAHFEYGARVVIKGESTTALDDEAKLGLRLTVTKANHIRKGQVSTWAFRFEGDDLVEHRVAAKGEFPDFVVSSTPVDKITNVLREVGSLTVEEICKETELNRNDVYAWLKMPRFQRLDGGGGRGNKAKYGLSLMREETV